jgi:hypothetical protein
LEKLKICYLHLLFRPLILSLFFIQNAFSQPDVGFDSRYNNETSAKTGRSFHYLWADIALSGYSGWGKIFTTGWAKITTIRETLHPEGAPWKCSETGMQPKESQLVGFDNVPNFVDFRFGKFCSQDQKSIIR